MRPVGSRGKKREGITMACQAYLSVIDPTWKRGTWVRSGGYFRESI